MIGEAGLAQELEAVGGLKAIRAPDSVPITDIDYVVMGIDRQFTYDKLRFAHAAITRGHAQFIATNRDTTFPMETGEIPGGGSLVAALAAATGREPLTIGKPETHAYEAILASRASPRRAKCHDRRPAGHGYRRGQPGRGQTVLVLTGVTSPVQAQAAVPPFVPDNIIGDLRELV